MPFVPDDFAVPTTYEGPGFRLEPLADKHNERDHQAWTSSMDHIRATPGMGGREWPHPMTIAENLADMQMHWREFVERTAFTYSILDADEVIGCVYIYPDGDVPDSAHVRSWVRADRAEMDAAIWRSLSTWLADAWPFVHVRYAER